ncbi:hypothetical protein BU23DRAFT_8038 [Bimuria novae-zelandiae CBS 107.79]|uniref:C3H1-type domain-containing protein n=1 Tax=Bimuria novae-zelandiae CBS 107.79 TaxID=1447943 RepID=A0A6A5VUZ4_9PLEO|nr:hypothetical protein BU23DRAFT_8038 [Bimuria novae-zelandiae CBS 107.79]
MATTQAPSAGRLDPSIRYYIHRTHGNAIVPLIPADQLPFQLKDFPRNMEHRQLSEGGWKFIGETPEIPFPLPLLSPLLLTPVTSTRGRTLSNVTVGMKDGFSKAVAIARMTPVELATEALGKEGIAKEVFTIPNEAISTEKKTTAPAVLNRECRTNIKSLTDSMADIYTKDVRRVGYTKPSPTKPNTAAPKEREYCRHWVKTGNCIHTTKRCWYKHEMPPPEKLKEIGLADIPQWYQDKNRSMARAPLLKPLPRKGPGKQGAVTVGVQQAAESYGVYTTDTADELMLMDVDGASPSPPHGRPPVDKEIAAPTPPPTPCGLTPSLSLLPDASPSEELPNPTTRDANNQSCFNILIDID